METTNNKIDKLEALAELVNAIRETVADIESKPEVYKGHYIEYVDLLNTLRIKFPKVDLRVWDQIITKAGANQYGLNQAINLLRF
jgi:hypothetical protein